MADLRGCPFCGGEPDLMKMKSERFDIERYECFCFDCGCATGKFEFMEDAVLAWNDRPKNMEEKFYSTQQVNTAICARFDVSCPLDGVDGITCQDGCLQYGPRKQQ